MSRKKAATSSLLFAVSLRLSSSTGRVVGAFSPPTNALRPPFCGVSNAASVSASAVNRRLESLSPVTATTTRRRTTTALKANPGSMYEKVLENPKWPPEWPYSPQDFARMDEEDDSIFYNQPRLVYHIDDVAVSALTEYYSQHLHDGDDVLDICSSWVSHFPEIWKGGDNVIGLGMNEYELSQNGRLTSYVVKDLNADPTFPFDDESFDKVTCVVSVDYLNKPREVFAEIGRVLRPGGVCILSMSNRCFPTKAFQIWLQTNDLEHVFIAGSFFHYSGLFDPPRCDDISPNPGRSDPLFIVRAAKKSKSES